ARRRKTARSPCRTACCRSAPGIHSFRARRSGNTRRHTAWGTAACSWFLPDRQHETLIAAASHSQPDDRRRPRGKVRDADAALRGKTARRRNDRAPRIESLDRDRIVDEDLDADMACRLRQLDLKSGTRECEAVRRTGNGADAEIRATEPEAVDGEPVRASANQLAGQISSRHVVDPLGEKSYSRCP